MKKRTYRKSSFKTLDVPSLVARLGGTRKIVIAIDVGKTEMVAAVADPTAGPQEQVLQTIGFKYPAEHADLVAFLRAMSRADVTVEAVMEPSGTYGDALRHQLQQLGVAVYRVATHRTKNAAELFDGVPSLHDAKSAHILCKLHLDRASRPWRESPEVERGLSAAIAIMDLHRMQRQQQLGRLEALLARHWPELLSAMQLGSASQLSLLARVGGPEQVAATPDQSTRLLREVSQGMLKAHVVEKILDCARHSVGVPLCSGELELLQTLCDESLRTLDRHQRAVSRVRKLGKETDAVLLSALVGEATATLLVHDVGSPKSYGSARAYLKAYGLNLREKSSGNFKGKLKLTKRGPSRARRYLFLAALRLLRSDPCARAYYAAKVARDGGGKMRAVVALMRKLAKGLYAMAHTEQPYDAAKLFDLRRLTSSAA